MSDLDVLKDIPGYKAILKSVLKSQIQLLIQQLSEHAGEESIILTASVHDGTLSHLGSSNGKGFLEGRDEIKSQFLGYCLKTYHKQKTHEPQKPYQRTHPSPRTPSQMTGPFPKRSRMPSATFSESSSIGYLPVSQTAPSEMSDFDSEMPKTRSEVHCTDTRIKTEHIDNQSEESVTGSFGNVPLPPARDTYQKTAGSSATGQYSSGDSGVNTPSVDPDAGSENLEGNDTDSSNVSAVKVEQVEDELEITGVELAAAGWSQGQAGFGTDSDTSFSQAGDQSGYSTGFQTATSSQSFQSDNNYNSIKHTVTPIFKRQGHIDTAARPKDRIPKEFTTKNFRHEGNDPEAVTSLPDTSKSGFQVNMDSMMAGSHGDDSNKKHQSEAWLQHGYITGDAYRPFGCKYCAKQFTYKADLKRHVRIHTGERPFKCSYCTKSFTQSTHLKLHVVRHMDLNRELESMMK